MSNSIATQTMLIGEVEVPVLEYKGQRVVTFAMIDKVHQRPERTARERFRDNRRRFVEEKHFYLIDYSKRVLLINLETPPRGLILLTQEGYLLIAKSFRLSTEITQLICQNYFQDKSTNFIQANAYESEFGQILIDTLKGLAIVDTQVRIGKYRVDFLIREHHLIVEYDEERHARPICREKDRRRERALIALGYKIIRVKKKESIGKALNKVLNVLWDNKSNIGIETNAKVVRSAHD